MMQAGQPFEFAENKKLTSKPICWTNKPKLLNKSLAIPVEAIEAT
jgi:hypothetical protein